MNSNLKIPFSSKSITQFLYYLGHYLNKNPTTVTQKSLAFQSDLDTSLSDESSSYFHEEVDRWWQGHSKYFVLNSNEVKGLSLRFYKAQLTLTKTALVPIADAKVAVVYLRYRDALTSKLKTIKVAHLTTANIGQLVKATYSFNDSKSGDLLVYTSPAYYQGQIGVILDTEYIVSTDEPLVQVKGAKEGRRWKFYGMSKFFKVEEKHSQSNVEKTWGLGLVVSITECISLKL